jgi:acetyl-CoA carboxylase biotin carboxyl carrier protein
MEIENLLKLIDTVSRSELTGFRYEENGVKLNLSKKKEKIQTVQSVFEPIMAEKKVAVSESDKVEETTDIEDEIISSPLVGTYYEAPAEGADSFVKVGDIVKKGQTLAIIEAMKLMNEIESEYDGVIKEIMVSNGQPVEFGQPLFRIEQEAR